MDEAFNPRFESDDVGHGDTDLLVQATRQGPERRGEAGEP